MRERTLHALIVWIALFAFWVVLSGKLDAVHLAMGVASAAAVTLLSGGRLYSLDDSGRTRWLSLLPWGRILGYLPWLGWEIAKANIQVLVLVFSPLSRLSPRVVRLRPDLSSEVSRTALGNSITLTPGTVTLDVTPDGDFLVHAIDGASADALLEGTMIRKVAHTFREGEADA